MKKRWLIGIVLALVISAIAPLAHAGCGGNDIPCPTTGSTTPPKG